MTNIGTVESLWRYPVKSMRGIGASEVFIGFAGVFGDRCFALRDTKARAGFPYLNGPRQPEMLRYQPRFRTPDRAMFPPNLSEASSIAPGVTPSNGNPDDLALDVITPSGTAIALDDPTLLEMLTEGLRGEHSVSVIRSDRALTDCRPVSLIALQTIKQLGAEMDKPLDKLRFRSNIYMNLTSGEGFGEDALVGRKLRIGDQVEIMVLERDPRCKMISLDHATGEHDPDIFRHVAQSHEANSGVYCAVLVEGIARTGDSIDLLD
ncbi:MAG: MOSC domain-containing protein [Pyrinomonadaceae bacterium]